MTQGVWDLAEPESIYEKLECVVAFVGGYGWSLALFLLGVLVANARLTLNIIPTVYMLSLALLPRQWRQETDSQRRVTQAGEEKTAAVGSAPAPSSTAH